MRGFPRMKGTENNNIAKTDLKQPAEAGSSYLPNTLPQPNRKKELFGTGSSGEIVLRGGMTVEAALVFPFFLGLCALFFTFFAGQLLGLSLQKDLDAVCEDVAVWSYAVDFAESYTGTDLMSLADGGALSGALTGREEDIEALLSGEADLLAEIGTFLKEKASAFLWQALLKSWLIGRVGREKLDNSPFLENGAAGLSLSGSTLHGRELDLVLTYRVRCLLPFPFALHYKVVQRSCRRLWIGTVRTAPEEEGGEEASSEAEEQMVYVTAAGTVYHRTKYCRSLDIKVLAVDFSEIGPLRNNYGGKYYPCERCALRSGVQEGTVYLTREGDRYHIKRDCPSLKRTLIELSISEAQEKYRACRFCGDGS